MRDTSPMECPFNSNDPYYGTYLGVTKLLELQTPHMEGGKLHAHDEMLFIIIHQTYELWFKQILHELDACREVLKERVVDDNSPDMNVLVHRLKRVVEIWKVLNHQVDVLETMTPLDFLDFRARLEPASGFQSFQFRQIEAALGLRSEGRHKADHYKHTTRGGFSSEDVGVINKREEEVSVLQLVDLWLSRMPFFEDKFWQEDKEIPNVQIFWNRYRSCYEKSIPERKPEDKIMKEKTMKQFDDMLMDNGDGGFSAASLRAALFITLYRDEPLLRLPFDLLNALIEIDEQIANFRYRHYQMVRRMIGTRIGTGGNSPEKYLRGTVTTNQIFAALAGIITFLVERRDLPKLPQRLHVALSFGPV